MNQSINKKLKEILLKNKDKVKKHPLSCSDNESWIKHILNNEYEERHLKYGFKQAPIVDWFELIYIESQKEIKEQIKKEILASREDLRAIIWELAQEHGGDILHYNESIDDIYLKRFGDLKTSYNAGYKNKEKNK